MFYGPSVGYLVERSAAPAAAIEVCLTVNSACPAHAGVISLAYVYIPRLNAALLQHQVHLAKSLFLPR